MIDQTRNCLVEKPRSIQLNWNCNNSYLLVGWWPKSAKWSHPRPWAGGGSSALLPKDIGRYPESVSLPPDHFATNSFHRTAVTVRSSLAGSGSDSVRLPASASRSYSRCLAVAIGFAPVRTCLFNKIEVIRICFQGSWLNRPSSAKFQMKFDWQLETRILNPTDSPRTTLFVLMLLVRKSWVSQRNRLRNTKSTANEGSELARWSEVQNRFTFGQRPSIRSFVITRLSVRSAGRPSRRHLWARFKAMQTNSSTASILP